MMEHIRCAEALRVAHVLLGRVQQQVNSRGDRPPVPSQVERHQADSDDSKSLLFYLKHGGVKPVPFRVGVLGHRPLVTPTPPDETVEAVRHTPPSYIGGLS